MKKIQTSSKSLLEDLGNFYDAMHWHYVTVNGVDVGGGCEIQYFFAKYGMVDEIVCFYMTIGYDEEIPSIVSLIPSAYLGEGEVVDMFGAKIHGVAKGTFLEEDSIQTPLRRES